MRRFEAEGTSLDRKTLSEASMRISTLIENERDFADQPSALLMLRQKERHKSGERLNALRNFYRARIKYLKFNTDSALGTAGESLPSKPLGIAQEASRQTNNDSSRSKKSETHDSSLRKLMQCDSCRNPIKISRCYYVCSTCNDGDYLYCIKCVDKGRTCRHELTERIRTVKKT